jgi:hypothetical protein
LVKRYENFTYALNKARIPVLVVVVMLLFFLIFIKLDFNSFILRSVNDRIGQLKTFEIVEGLHNRMFHVEQFSSSFFGLGMGQYVNQIIRIFNSGLEAWQYQPVHNVFLLIFGELGIIGLALFFYFLWKLFHPLKILNVSRETFNDNGTSEEKFLERDNSDLSHFVRPILIGFLVIMLFDHYFWDIQQGQAMFWLVAGVLAGLVNVQDKYQTDI